LAPARPASIAATKALIGTERFAAIALNAVQNASSREMLVRCPATESERLTTAAPSRRSDESVNGRVPKGPFQTMAVEAPNVGVALQRGPYAFALGEPGGSPGRARPRMRLIARAALAGLSEIDDFAH